MNFEPSQHNASEILITALTHLQIHTERTGSSRPKHIHPHLTVAQRTLRAWPQSSSFSASQLKILHTLCSYSRTKAERAHAQYRQQQDLCTRRRCTALTLWSRTHVSKHYPFQGKPLDNTPTDLNDPEELEEKLQYGSWYFVTR